MPEYVSPSVITNTPAQVKSKGKGTTFVGILSIMLSDTDKSIQNKFRGPTVYYQGASDPKVCIAGILRLKAEVLSLNTGPISSHESPRPTMIQIWSRLKNPQLHKCIRFRPLTMTLLSGRRLNPPALNQWNADTISKQKQGAGAPTRNTITTQQS